ncbi:hypothetical protein [Paraburkholderia youngii]|uniref:hypothetical protein n=1 Tax=Paraburkholderia youngii TaxID=2782701 RepID=UPI003D1EAD01
MNRQTMAARAGHAYQGLSLSTFAVDALQRVAQRVKPEYSAPPCNRFFVVVAHGPTEAIELAMAAHEAGCNSVAEYKVKRQFCAQLT